MSFALIIFDYDGVLIDSLSTAISAGEEFCRWAAHDRLPTVETIESLEITTYSEIAHSIGLLPEQAERFSSYIFERFRISAQRWHSSLKLNHYFTELR